LKKVSPDTNTNAKIREALKILGGKWPHPPPSPGKEKGL
jgi:hypothetical protein